jgi:hypothetical protein
MILNHARLPFRHTRGLPRGERRDLNPRPLGPQPSALPTELRSPQYSAPRLRQRAGRCWDTCPTGPETRLAGFEPAAHGLEVRCSIQLSYRRTRRHGHQNADQKESGRRESNPRQTAWKADALPSELHPPVQPATPTDLMVGTRGFEPPTTCSQSRCATRLRHVPTAALLWHRPREYSVSAWGLPLYSG